MPTDPPVGPPIFGPRRSLCLYRRSAGRNWWRVDADIAPSGALALTSGDASEWQVIVAAADVPALLRALRREGDLADAVGGDADDELLARLARRFGGEEGKALDAFKTCLADHHIPFETRFWAGDTDDDAGGGVADDPRRALAGVLREMTAMVGREEADFTWSSWEDAGAARAELAGLSARLAGEPFAVADTLTVIVAPAGPLQELAMASGWAGDFLALAARADAAIDALRASPPP